MVGARYVVRYGVILVLMFGACGEAMPIEDIPPDVTTDISSPPLVYTCEPQFVNSYEMPASHACHLLDQGCPLATEACFLDEASTQCLEIGTSGCGEPCVAANDCPQGAVCLGDPGRCLAMCSPGTTCQVGTRCRPIAAFDLVGFCPLPCSILEQDCPDTLACYLVAGNQECAPPENPALQEGQLCDVANRCKKGLICQESDGGRCRVPCRLDGPACELGTCVGLIGLEPLGVCISGG